jgi:hypothetical protein
MLDLSTSFLVYSSMYLALGLPQLKDILVQSNTPVVECPSEAVPLDGGPQTSNNTP